MSFFTLHNLNDKHTRYSFQAQVIIAFDWHHTVGQTIRGLRYRTAIDFSCFHIYNQSFSHARMGIYAHRSCTSSPKHSFSQSWERAFHVVRMLRFSFRLLDLLLFSCLTFCTHYIYICSKNQYKSDRWNHRKKLFGLVALGLRWFIHRIATYINSYLQLL